MACPTCQ